MNNAALGFDMIARLGVPDVLLASGATGLAYGCKLLENPRASGIADVAFDISETAARWLADSTISGRAALLPQRRILGEVKDLSVAMMGGAALQGTVTSFVANPSNDDFVSSKATCSLASTRTAV